MSAFARHFEREFENFNVGINPPIENPGAMNINNSIHKLINFISNTSIHYHTVVDLISISIAYGTPSYYNENSLWEPQDARK